MIAKNPLTGLLDAMSSAAHSMTRSEAIAKHVCVRCAKPVDHTNLRTPSEVKEYRISAYCGVCWDEIFDPAEDDSDEVPVETLAIDPGEPVMSETERLAKVNDLVTVYTHFTLREWKIITGALADRRKKVGYFTIDVDGDGKYVSDAEFEAILIKCPSAAL